MIFDLSLFVSILTLIIIVKVLKNLKQLVIIITPIQGQMQKFKNALGSF